MLATVDRRRADLLGDRDPLGRAASDVEDARARQAEARRRLFALARDARRRARRHGHASAQRLPRAAHHRHGALPPRRGRAQVRRVAQQHVLAPRPRRRAGRRPRGARLRPAAPGAAAAAGRQRELALHRRARLRPALRPHARSSPSRSRAAASRTRSAPGRLGRLRRAARAHRLDRRVHAALVVRAPAPRLRHRRGADLRRADDRGRGRRARRADRRLRAPGGGGGRRGRGAARPARPADRGEHVARDPLRARRAAARPRGAAGRGVPAPPRRSTACNAWTGADVSPARAQRRPAPARA